MGPPVRERHNAKARGSVKGGRSHKKAKTKSKATVLGGDGAVEDTNAEILQLHTKEDKADDRRARLQAELEAQSESKMTSKKRRRLENYINKKLAKEERVQILQKLAHSQAQLPSSLSLVTSASLGSGNAFSHAEKVMREEDKMVRRALDGRNARNRKHRRMDEFVEEEESESGYEMGEEGPRNAEDVSMEALGVINVDDNNAVDDPPWTGFGDDELDNSDSASLHQDAVPPMPAAVVPTSELGSAFARNTDGTVVAPIIVKRARKAKRKLGLAARLMPASVAVDGTESDSSFDSSDSAYDSSEEEEVDGEDTMRSSVDEDEDSDEQVAEDEQIEEVIKLGKRKRAGFKQWASKQLGIAKGWEVDGQGAATVSQTAHTDEAVPPTVTSVSSDRSAAPLTTSTDFGVPARAISPVNLPLALPSTPFSQAFRALPTNPHNHVSVSRPAQAAADRLLLPIVSEEQEIVEAVRLNPVVVICGETGSGKTTQVPGMLFEAGFANPKSDNPGMIAITQPRRVAAMSTSARVSYELALPPPRVAYAVRYDHTTSPNTSIKFMTDGVLLRELAGDFLLEKYSVVIVDEAHERSLGTDVLVGVLSRVVKLRERRWIEGKGKPLRLIIMSATLRVADFTQNPVLFPTPPPVIQVAARQHPVTIHFSRITQPDYVGEAARKVEKIHTRLPPGGILVFLTGQREIEVLCKRLEGRWGRKALAAKRGWTGLQVSKNHIYVNMSAEDDKVGGERPIAVNARDGDVEAEEVDLGGRDDDIDVVEEEDAAALNSEEDYEDGEQGIDEDSFDVPMHILPLYSLLASDKQMKVFEDPPSDTRLVVIATNVAETSLTIPGIRYVVDSGRSKQRRFDPASGIQAFQISWESKASAAQRAGRAGRTGPGHCYRLYSSAVFENHFEPFTEPEILRMPIEGVVLQMKGMNIDNVVSFPFPTPPNRLALRKAEALLTHLGALEPAGALSGTTSIAGRMTELGRAMALFPVSPRFGKMLVTGKQHGCLPYVIAIVAALSVGDPFLREEAVGQADAEDEAEQDYDGMDVPELAHIRSDALKEKEERKSRRRMFFQSQQIHAALGHGKSDVFRVLSVVGAYEYEDSGQIFCSKHFVRFKAMEEIRKLRAQISAIMQANFGNGLSTFNARLSPPNDVQVKALRQLLTAGFVDQVAVRKEIVQPSTAAGMKYSSTRGVAYRAVDVEEDVYIHPSSVVFHSAPPDFVVFQEIVRTSRVWIKTVTVINPVWLPTLGRSLCTFSKPLDAPKSIKANAAPATVDSRQVLVIPRFGPAAWELPPVSITQRREWTRWVYVHST